MLQHTTEAVLHNSFVCTKLRKKYPGLGKKNKKYKHPMPLPVGVSEWIDGRT